MEFTRTLKQLCMIKLPHFHKILPVCLRLPQAAMHGDHIAPIHLAARIILRALQADLQDRLFGTEQQASPSLEHHACSPPSDGRRTP
jgi:hypothetical protein